MTAVSQVGTDRIIEIQFSDGQYRLFLEFYAAGNIILTNKDLGILALFRVIAEGAEQERLRVGLSYSLENRQNYGGAPDLTPERIKEGLEKATKNAAEGQLAPKKSRKKGGNLLRKALSTTLNEFPPPLLEHALTVTKLDPGTTPEQVLEDEKLLDQVFHVLKSVEGIIEEVVSSGSSKGFIIAKRKEGKPKPDDSEKENSKREDLLYDDFQPFRPAQFDDKVEFETLEFDGFNKTVDEFFSSVESQKLESRLTEREQAAQRKLDNARKDHARRVEGLQEVQEVNVRKAEAIESNLHKVQEAIGAINGLVAQGMDWIEIARLIEMEQARHNPVAEMIKLPLKLYENTATLLLQEPRFEEDEDFEGDETDSDVSEVYDDDASNEKQKGKASDRGLAVDVDLALTPWANARQYYEHKKSAAVKEQRTLQSSKKALKSTEEKVQADLRKGLKQEKEIMRPVRKQLWFEKFHFFISSEGYLVVGGRDASQNEILYRRYFQKGDIYVHADLHGAASIIVKNKPGFAEFPIPPSTLSQAGTLAVSTSSAWDSKAGMSAWWVKADQVSKTAPTGEYLMTGGFTIRGQKNYLPPAQLLLGFAVMFRVSEESKARHIKHRLVDDSIRANNTINQGQYESNTAADGEANSNDFAEESHNEDDGYKTPDLIDEADSVDGFNPSDVSREEQQNPLQPPRPGEDSRESPTTADSTLSTDSDDLEPGLQSTPVENQDLDPSRNPDTVLEQQEIDPNHSTNPASETRTDPSTTTTTITPTNQPIGSTKPRQVRGKHGKRQKFKTKYADQTPSDRALALRLLGSAPNPEKTTSLADEKAAKEKALAEQKERRRRQHALAAQRGKEAEEKRMLNLQEGIETLDDNVEDAKAIPGDLDAWVGTPLPGDEILDCLVVCGPWDAVGARCRYRVKIQPGSVKKGKAVREILGKWNADISAREKGSGSGKRKAAIERMMEGSDERVGNGEKEARRREEEEEKLSRREGELIKGLREAEVIGVVPVGKCRVVMGGGGGGGGEEVSKKGRGGGQAGKGGRGGKGSKRK